MDLISQVTLMGGACDRASLIAIRGRREVDAALRDGTLVRCARGRYALPTTREFVRRAASVAGVLSHRSAAVHWGWAQKSVPTKAEVTVSRDRRLSRRTRELIVPHWSQLEPEDVDGMVTTPRRTLVDCMRNLPPDESLAIADSALRADDFTSAELLELAESTSGRGRTRIQKTAAAATSKAANPFESVLRSQAGLVPGLQVQAQFPVPVPGSGLVLHPDVADPMLQIALEAEGFEWHSQSAALTRDCRRYNALVKMRWMVIRFSWYLVMHDPAYVHQTLIDAVELARQHANVA
jgi:very-short-patch-repair endonuclease